MDVLWNFCGISMEVSWILYGYIVDIKEFILYQYYWQFYGNIIDILCKIDYNIIEQNDSLV